jgi:hypothetical protein
MACERVHQAAINRIPHTYSMICSPTEIVESHCFAVFTLKKSTPLILRLDYWQLMFLEGYWQLGHSSLSELKKRKDGFCPFVSQKGQKKEKKKISTHDCCEDKTIIQAPNNHVDTSGGGQKPLTGPIPSWCWWWHGRWRNTQVICLHPPSHFSLTIQITESHNLSTKCIGMPVSAFRNCMSLYTFPHKGIDRMESRTQVWTEKTKFQQ